VGAKGGTGHDYNNHFVGDDLVWFAKNRSHLRQPQTQGILNPIGRVYLFYREKDRDPFVFAGSAYPREVFDTTPVKVVWGFRSVDSKRQDHVLPEEIDEESGVVIEGARKSVLVNIYERDPNARRRCIAHYHPICTICEFDFAKVYGDDLGRGFIHVHHLKPLGTVKEAYELDPIRDLRPVCPNCHAMLHRRKKVLTIEELKKHYPQTPGRFELTGKPSAHRGSLVISFRRSVSKYRPLTLQSLPLGEGRAAELGRLRRKSTQFGR
jgi:5-methylcytosine-specific restriction enzyme A